MNIFTTIREETAALAHRTAVIDGEKRLSYGQLIVAAANDRLFAKLAGALAHPEWTNDPRFRSNADRVVNKDVLIPLVAEIFRRQKSAHWVARLEDVGVPCAPINDLSIVKAHAQTAALGMLQPAPKIGMDLMSLPLSFDAKRPRILSRAPRLGEHNAIVEGVQETASPAGGSRS